MEPDIDVTSTWPNAACDDMSDRPLEGFGGYLWTRWTVHIYSKNLLQTCRPARPDISAYIFTTFADGYVQPHPTYQVHLGHLHQHPSPRLHQSHYSACAFAFGRWGLL